MTRLPEVRTDIDFKTLVARLQDKHIAVLAGNPSHIDGPSPLKRVGDVGHAMALLRSRRSKDGLASSSTTRRRIVRPTPR